MGKPRWLKKATWPRLIFILSSVVVALGVSLGAGWGWLTADLPRPGDLTRHVAAPSTQILDRHGRLLYEVIDPSRGRHTPVAWDDIPPYLLQATVATEDASFYSHPGVDLWAILRALWINLQGGEVLSGGSTITQQLARNLLLSPEERAQRTLTRKLRESILAWQLVRTYSRNEILALYLNEIYYGNYAYGVEAAAQAYFSKHVSELDLAECALLAGLPQAPSAYNPLINLEAARQRQRVVLELMVKQGFISEDDAVLACAEPLHFASTPFPIRAPHFVMYVQGLLEESLGHQRLEQGGLRVHTTLDLALQETAQRIARRHLARLADARYSEQDRNVSNAALVALDPRTGEILVMLGSPDYFDTENDGAVNVALTLRQPGSSIKPITYAVAFDPAWAAGHGETPYTPATMIADVRTTFLTRENRPYTPRNYDGLFHGPVLARQALASSLNVATVKVLDHVGVEAMIRQARRMGITTFDATDRFGLALTLGGGEVRLLELGAAYAALANGGFRVEPVAIRRVEDVEGHVVWAPRSGRLGRVLDERVAYLISDVLADDWARMSAFGEGSVLQLNRPAAVKTGTTSDWRDNWTVGYTPDLVVGVWAGNADNSPMRGVSGISGAAPMWHDFIQSALRGWPMRQFLRPEGLVEVEICALSGQRAGPHCPHRHEELFIAGTEPKEECDWHRALHIDTATALLADPGTPLSRVVERVYTILPPELAEWGRAQGIEPPPVAASASHSGDHPTTGEVFSTSVSLFSSFPLLMVSPDPWTVYRISPRLPASEQRILVEARPGTGARLAKVVLLADGHPLATLVRPPYRALWTLTPGEHTFQAVGHDESGKVLESEMVTVTVVE